MHAFKKRSLFIAAALCALSVADASLAAARGAPVRAREAAPLPKRDFNRNAIGGASGVNPALRQRAYKVVDGLARPGGARAMGLRSHEFRNDGRNGSATLPTTTPSGKPIAYTTTYLRPSTPGRSHANARVTTGNDGSAWISRHHGDGGGKIKRIQ